MPYASGPLPADPGVPELPAVPYAGAPLAPGAVAWDQQVAALTGQPRVAEASRNLLRDIAVGVVVLVAANWIISRMSKR